MDDITYKDAFIIGSFQAATIFPAISRSGMTIVAALWRKLDRETAAYFSFLLSTPAIVGAIILQFADVFQGKAESISSTSLIIGTLSAAFFWIHSRFMDDSIFKTSLLKSIRVLRMGIRYFNFSVAIY